MASVTEDSPANLRRRNSNPSPVPTKLDLPAKPQSSSFPTANGDNRSFLTVDFELVNLKPMSYTSLKDLMPSSPAAIQSPTAAGAGNWNEISIRNRLVKQAAWAYLQPMAVSPESSNQHFFHRIRNRFSSEFRNPVNACLGFINFRVIPTIARAFNRLLGAFWIGRSRKR
eukprot:TRINITY_DN8404_c0_g1_i1.p1 TRINITY_DN8404_c0_g1~~TRINITY_DN8404_c0_g1_i1.p1  ORF type:complete len:170 (+),score=0.66 TRINITY_DN8404_c0_g1_i1:134-643(+)